MDFTLAGLELPIRVRPERALSDEELLRLCAANDVLRIESEPNGELTVMSPSGSGTGNANAQITYQLVKWAEEDGRGTAFDSNAGFRLPDGSVRSPDASWISWPKWNALTAEQVRGFSPICPEFVVELRSPGDSLQALRRKMQHWIANGAELAWLIDPERKIVEVYRPSQTEPDVHDQPTAVYGEGPVGGFALELARIWR
jgi:Uma2 family endonuclease